MSDIIYVNTWGNDTATGTIEDPLLSIDVAISKVTTSDTTIILGNGTYTTQTSLNALSTDVGKITIEGQGMSTELVVSSCDENGTFKSEVIFKKIIIKPSDDFSGNTGVICNATCNTTVKFYNCVFKKSDNDTFPTMNCCFYLSDTETEFTNKYMYNCSFDNGLSASLSGLINLYKCVYEEGAGIGTEYADSLCASIGYRYKLDNKYDNLNYGVYSGEYAWKNILYVMNIQVSPDNVHYENSIVTAELKNPLNKSIKYNITLNDDIIFESDVFTDISSINYTIENNLLDLSSNKLIINLFDNDDIVDNEITNITLYNANPTGIFQLDKIETHKDNINLTGTLSDTDSDKISYRILINDSEVLPWNEFTENPQINYTISYKQLNLGYNTLTIEFKDDYKLEALDAWNSTIKLINSTPVINTLEYNNGIINFNISDEDNDKMQYNIYLNDNKIYPISEYTKLDNYSDEQYSIYRKNIKHNETNTIVINVKDEFNTFNSKNVEFIGDYVGLMFCDENKQYYTSDIGELLNYLNFNITLGQTSEIKKVLVQNKYGLTLKRILIDVENNLSNINVQLSKTEYPFEPSESLVFDKEYQSNQEEEFFIRLESNHSIIPTIGNCIINVRGIIK